MIDITRPPALQFTPAPGRVECMRTVLAGLALPLFFVTGSAMAQTQIQVPLQGVLTDAQSRPLEESVSLTFSLYANATATTPLWREVQQVEVGRVFPGVYDVRLGAVTALGAELFRDNPA